MTAMPPEVRVQHSYPEAMAFLRAQGSDAMAVLHDLLTHAERWDGRLVVQASVRQVADRLGFLSKDTVHRRLRQLVRADILRRMPTDPTQHFHPPTYAINLAESGITLLSATDPRTH